MKINISLSHIIRARIHLFTIALLAAVVLGSPSRSNAATTPDPVRSWNELALQTVRDKNATDAQAARLYAMVNVAMYDAVNGIITRHGAHTGREHALIPATGAPPQGDLNLAAAAAAHAVLSGEFPEFKDTRYGPQLTADRALAGPGNKSVVGEEWGASVGNQVRAARANDGSTPIEPPQPPGSGPGEFRGSFSNPQFRNLQPFGIADSSVYYGAGPAPLPSLDYAAAFDVVKFLGKTTPNTGSAAENAQKLGTFQFWALGNNTSQPPGAWIQIALAVLETHPRELPEATRLLALETTAMADTVAPTYYTKFHFHHWRPTTAINEANTDGNDLTEPDTGTWTSRGGVGGSPEYWSGHSSFSAAAAEVLAGFFCDDNISFTFTADTTPSTPPTPANQPRTYPSFSAAAEEAGISRIYGGLHFPFSNTDGLAAGKAVAAEILANKLLLRNGPTHFGQCPR